MSASTYTLIDFPVVEFIENSNDEKNLAAYPPKALMKLILLCYSKGIISSRKIEIAGKEKPLKKSSD